MRSDETETGSAGELTALIGRVLDGAATTEERVRLNDWLLRDGEARRVYRRYVNLHAALRSRYALPVGQREALRASERKEPRRAESLAWRAGRVAAVLAVLAGLSWAGVALWGPGPVVAHLSKASGARWGASRQALAANAQLKSGHMDLSEGMAELTLSNGVRVVLEAPVQFNLHSAEKVNLKFGRLVAYVPPAATGFVIETPHSRVVDLGTEFGVGVNDGGETEVQVFRGEVITQVKGPQGQQIDRHLMASKAMSINTAAQTRGIPFQPQRFVRMFPTDNDSGQKGGPVYNRSVHSEVHVLPAPKTVAIDGDLGEWDTRGTFHSACMPPYRVSHYVDGTMMYDEKYLYVAAHVGDPAPMLSQMDPDADPQQYSWRGGSVIVRLVTDKALSANFNARGVPERTIKNPEYGTRPEDLSEQIVHLTMWYHQPAAKARLQVSYGMDFHGELTHPLTTEESDGKMRGWNGMFKRDADGRGYTLEYAVPWSLLNAASRPPQAGDRLASTWTVHWSDEKGALSHGHLVEITNPASKPFRFLRGDSWGKALFQGREFVPPVLDESGLR